MFKLIQLISLRADASAADRAALTATLQAATRDNPYVARARLAETGAYVVNGGDLHWHILFADEAAYHHCIRSPGWQAVRQALAADPVAHVDAVAYQQEATGLSDPAIRSGIHRTLILAMRPATPPEQVQRFEAEMREMARYVPVIRNWSLSRVTHATGTRGWTHVWEQEFAQEADLNGPYMMHPIHFASVDRWFDSQSHDWIVDIQLCHSYCAFTEGSVIAPPPG